MVTIEFKGFYIHCYTDSEKCHVELDTYKEFKTLKGAKTAITKYLNAQTAQIAHHTAQKTAK